MQSASVSPDEDIRLAALDRLHLLDTPAEERFDRITRTAVHGFHVPIALISLIDANRQWFKSCQGLSTKETPRSISFCAHAIMGDDVLVVPDTQLDPRFVDNPLVTGEPGIRFYAGHPLVAPDGSKVGTLCIIDRHPRTMNEADLQAFRDLAAWAQIELSVISTLEHELGTHRRQNEEARHFFALALDLFCIAGFDGYFKRLNPAWSKTLGFTEEELLAHPFLNFVHPDDQADTLEAAAQLIAGTQVASFENRYCCKDGTYRRLLWNATALPDQQLIYAVAYDITKQKQTAEALWASEARYRSVIDHIQEVIFQTDAVGRWTLLNPAWTEMTGFSLEESIGRNFLDFVYPNDWQSNIELFQTLAAGDSEYCRHEVRYLTRSGSFRWFEVYARLALDADGKIVGTAGTLNDISERKHTEAALQRRDAILEAVSFAAKLFLTTDSWEEYIQEVLERLGHAADVSRVYIFENHFDQHNTLLVSQRFEWTADGIVPQIDNPELQNLPYREVGFARWVDMLSKGELIYGHVRTFPSDEQEILASQDILSLVVVPIFVGSVWWGIIGFDQCQNEHDWSATEVDALKTATSTLGAAIQREWAQAALRSSETTNRALLNAIPDMMFRISYNGFFLDYKSAREEELLVSPTEFIGRQVFDILPPTLAQQLMQAIVQALQTNTVQIFEYQVAMQECPQDYEARIVVSGAAETLAIVRNITERKKMERMKNEFISTVSHELRTPLTSIRGSLGLITGGVAGELPSRVRTMVDIAYKNSERLVRLINDILDIEKIASGKMVFDLKPVELMSLIEQVVEANRAYAAEFGVMLMLEQHLSDIVINTDGDRLTQVLTNLLSNAAKFSPHDDTVIITVARQEHAIRVAITDHGPGIAEAFRDQIFQKFAQADSSDTRQKSGTGLGLSISKAIIERLGGTIGFETNLGTGTTFYFDLPQWSEIMPPMIDQTQAVLPTRVLICEDDQDVALLLQLLLKQSGFIADTAGNATQAKQLLAQNTYVAMVLDLILPDQDGVSLIRELRQDAQLRCLPIVVVSARAQEGRNEVNGGAFGVIDWLDKPVNQDRLTSAINEAVQQHIHGRLHILHIEDDPDVVQFVAMVLQPVADVQAAMTLQAARQWLTRETFDLILLDIGLPDGSGLELLTCLNQQPTPPTPIVIFSAQEVDMETAHQVAAVLIKSRTSNENLRDTIVSLAPLSLAHQNEEHEIPGME